MTDATEPTVVTQALKPCPFCGSEPLLEDGVNDRPWVVQCINTDCPAQPFMDHADTKRQALKAWNTRAAEQSRASFHATGNADELHAMGIDGSRSIYVRNPDGSWPTLPARIEPRASTPAVGREADADAALLKDANSWYSQTQLDEMREQAAKIILPDFDWQNGNHGYWSAAEALAKADAILALHPPASDDAIAAKDAEIDLAAIDAVIAEMIEVAVNDGEGDAAEVDFDRGDVDRWQAILQRASGHKNGFPSRAGKGCAVHGGNKVPGQCDLATCTYPFCERQP